MTVKKISATILSILFLFTFNFPAFATSQFNSDNQAIQETIKEYYNRSYRSWLNLELDDLEDVLSSDSIQMKNYVTALIGTIYRWKQVKAYSPEEVTNRECYEIFYDFKNIEIASNGSQATVSVTLSGETEGTPAYPIFVSLGSNTFGLIKEHGKWKIYSHNYNDVILYEESLTEEIALNKSEIEREVFSENTKLVSLIEESLPLQQAEPASNPYTEYAYSPSRAVAYAKKFVVNRNTLFYLVTSNGVEKDCTNFVSQAVSYGFGSGSSYSSFSSYRRKSGSYSTGWTGGSGGGTSSWENVGPHWTYMRSTKTNQEGPRTSAISVSSIIAGDVMQIDFTKDGTYDHTVICVDTSTKKFAQHSSNGFRYASDYSGNKRCYRPTRYRVY